MFICLNAKILCDGCGIEILERHFTFLARDSFILPIKLVQETQGSISEEGYFYCKACTERYKVDNG